MIEASNQQMLVSESQTQSSTRALLILALYWQLDSPNAAVTRCDCQRCYSIAATYLCSTEDIAQIRQLLAQAAAFPHMQLAHGYEARSLASRHLC